MIRKKIRSRKEQKHLELISKRKIEKKAEIKKKISDVVVLDSLISSVFSKSKTYKKYNQLNLNAKQRATFCKLIQKNPQLVAKRIGPNIEIIIKSLEVKEIQWLAETDIGVFCKHLKSDVLFFSRGLGSRTIYFAESLGNVGRFARALESYQVKLFTQGLENHVGRFVKGLGDLGLKGFVEGLGKNVGQFIAGLDKNISSFSKALSTSISLTEHFSAGIKDNVYYFAKGLKRTTSFYFANEIGKNIGAFSKQLGPIGIRLFAEGLGRNSKYFAQGMGKNNFYFVKGANENIVYFFEGLGKNRKFFFEGIRDKKAFLEILPEPTIKYFK